MKKRRTIIMVPHKIDRDGMIHIVPMVLSKRKGYKVRIKRLEAMGVFTSKDTMEIKKEDK